MYVPVYRLGTPLETIAQRRAALIGWNFQSLPDERTG